ANFVIRHSVVMLVLYVALIGSAGWLLAITPQGFIPAQDRGYVIISVQLPGAASLDRTTHIVREIERIALETPGVVRLAAVAGVWGGAADGVGQRGGVVPVIRREASAPEEGPRRSRHPAGRAHAVLHQRGRLPRGDPAARRARHRHRWRLRHAHPGPPGPWPA